MLWRVPSMHHLSLQIWTLQTPVFYCGWQSPIARLLPTATLLPLITHWPSVKTTGAVPCTMHGLGSKWRQPTRLQPPASKAKCRTGVMWHDNHRRQLPQQRFSHKNIQCRPQHDYELQTMNWQALVIQAAMAVHTYSTCHTASYSIKQHETRASARVHNSHPLGGWRATGLHCHTLPLPDYLASIWQLPDHYD